MVKFWVPTVTLAGSVSFSGTATLPVKAASLGSMTTLAWPGEGRHAPRLSISIAERSHEALEIIVRDVQTGMFVSLPGSGFMTS
jgi:hypothetical protein